MAPERVHVLGRGRLAGRLRDGLPALLPDVVVSSAPIGEELPRAGVAIPIVRLDRVPALAAWLGRLELALSIGLYRALVYIGPLRRAHQKGCLACLLSRVAGSADGPDVDANGEVIESSSRGDHLLYPLALAAIPRMLGVELAEHFAGRAPRSASGVIVCNQGTGEIGFEALVPDSSCSVCGDPPARRLPAWASEDEDRAPFDADRLRASDAPSIVLSIQSTYLNPYIGLIKQVQIDLQSPYGTCYLELPLKGKRSEPCIGRSTSYARAQSIAILEALERYCGWRRGGPRELINAPYSSVADCAVEPASLGLHPDACYDLPGYPFVRPTPELPIDWVWGFSFRRRAPVLVPARYAFYGHTGGRPFVYEVSNGCALGATLEEAILHGLLELVERDSFLLTWYRKLASPEVSTRDLPDRAARELLRRAELVTGSSIRLFLSTREHGIPSLFAVATSDVEGGPRTLAAGAAHPNLVHATISVLYELAGLALRMQTLLLERRDSAVRMLADASLVQQMEDHALVNCLPEARDRFAFLLEQTSRPLSFAEAQVASGPALRSTAHARDAVSSLVERVLRVGLDVIVVDQTMSELAPAGLHCAKVLAPGMLSMTFGHAYRRTEHLPRLVHPYPEARCGVAGIGAEPHPFP